MTTVRTARSEDRAAVRNVIDGADLALPDGVFDRALAGGAVLVAESDAGTILGALVLDGDRIVAVAVRRRRRGLGIGTALVEAAAAPRDQLVAEFDGDVSPFWEFLEFEVNSLPGGRARGVR